MHSIRVKITAVTIAAILTSIFALGGIGILTIGMESDQTSVEKIRLLTENTQQKLNAYLSSVEQSVEMAVHMADDSLENLDMFLLGSVHTQEEQEALDREIAEHCLAVEHAFSSIANHTNGVVTFYYCINADLGSTEKGFFWSKVGEDEFVKQPPLNSTELDINDTEHTTWYDQPLKAGRPVWVGPYKAHFLGDVMTVSYVAPIYRYGFLIGVLGMDILFDTFTSQISSIKVYDTGYAILLDQEGRVLYHPTMENGTTPEFVEQHKEEDLYKRLSSGDELIRYQSNGEERQLAFTTLRNKTKLAITAPVSEINAGRRRLTLIILLVAVVLLAVFTVITLLLMNALTKPLVRLAAASQKLMDGDYTAELEEYHGKDEVGTLTRSFRKMRDHMQIYISDLNSRAYTDALTGVKNKGAFDLSVNQMNSEIHEEKTAFAIIMFDLDNLKEINDQYGHERGDIYLQTACRLICRVFAHSPVYRVGGDEFCVLAQFADYNARDELLKKFDQEAEARNVKAEHPWERIEVSKGIAVYRPGKDKTAEQVYSRADEAMYKDKRRRKRT